MANAFTNSFLRHNQSTLGFFRTQAINRDNAIIKLSESQQSYKYPCGFRI